MQDVISFIKQQAIALGHNDYEWIILEMRQKRFIEFSKLKSKCVIDHHEHDEN